MQSIVGFFARWWLHGPRYRWSKIRRFLCERKYLKQPLPAANSLEDIEACLKQVRWKMEGLLHLYDSISYPQTTWVKKQDDCDGFACTAAELLILRGVPKKDVSLIGCRTETGAGHLVCAVVSERVTYIVDNRQIGLIEMGQLNYKWEKRMDVNNPGFWYAMEE